MPVRVEEDDRAAIMLGDAIRVEHMKREAGEIVPPSGYTVRCVFCHKDHVSLYWDVVEEGIMACRAAAPEWKRKGVTDEGGLPQPSVPAEWGG